MEMEVQCDGRNCSCRRVERQTSFENANQFVLAVFLRRSQLLRSPTCNFTKDDCTAETQTIDELLVWHANRRFQTKEKKNPVMFVANWPLFCKWTVRSRWRRNWCQSVMERFLRPTTSQAWHSIFTDPSCIPKWRNCSAGFHQNVSTPHSSASVVSQASGRKSTSLEGWGRRHSRRRTSRGQLR